MTRNAIVGLSVAVGAALLLFVTLGRPWPAPAQQPPADASRPPGYVGAETCKGCHEEAFKKFETTRMGRLFLKQPRNTTESLGCESCHGPGQKHVEAGGGEGVGGVITLSHSDKTPPDNGHAVAAQGGLAQQHLLHVSCREARPVSLGASSGQRKLCELPRSARLESREHAAGRQATTLPAVSHREPTSDQPLRSRHRVAQVRHGATVRELSRGHPRLEPSIRVRVYAVTRSA